MDWNTLSLDESLVWSDDFIDEFRDNWNYSNLSRNKSIPWCENLIDKYIDNWNWKLLSLNNAVPWNKDLVLKYFSRLSVLYIKIVSYMMMNVKNAKLFIFGMSKYDY